MVSPEVRAVNSGVRRQRSGTAVLLKRKSGKIIIAEAFDSHKIIQLRRNHLRLLICRGNLMYIAVVSLKYFELAEIYDLTGRSRSVEQYRAECSEQKQLQQKKTWWELCREWLTRRFSRSGEHDGCFWNQKLERHWNIGPSAETVTLDLIRYRGRLVEDK